MLTKIAPKKNLKQLFFLLVKSNMFVVVCVKFDKRVVGVKYSRNTRVNSI